VPVALDKLHCVVGCSDAREIDSDVAFAKRFVELRAGAIEHDP
jgi:hypothetical protein